MISDPFCHSRNPVSIPVIPGLISLTRIPASARIRLDVVISLCLRVKMKNDKNHYRLVKQEKDF